MGKQTASGDDFKPGQTKELNPTAADTEALTIFYETLYEQRPDSRMAQEFLVKHGLLGWKEAEAVNKKLGNKAAASSKPKPKKADDDDAFESKPKVKKGPAAKAPAKKEPPKKKPVVAQDDSSDVSDAEGERTHAPRGTHAHAHIEPPARLVSPAQEEFEAPKPAAKKAAAAKKEAPKPAAKSKKPPVDDSSDEEDVPLSQKMKKAKA